MGNVGFASVAVLLVCLFSAGCSDSDATQEAVEAEITEFVWEFDAATDRQDLDFLVDTLHPVTFTHWSPDECREAHAAHSFRGVKSIDDIEAVGDSFMKYGADDDGNWRYGDFEDGYRVHYTATDGLPGSMFVAFVEGSWRWFSNCDPDGVE